MSSELLPQAIAELLLAQGDYAATQATAAAQLAEAQLRRETAMRRVGALGLSHRRLAELTGLSHTRINQILGTGTKRPPDDIHFPDGFLPPPTTVARAALRVIALRDRRAPAWSLQEIAEVLAMRGWPSDALESVLVELVTDGVLLSVDGGYFTLHGYGEGDQTAPPPPSSASPRPVVRQPEVSVGARDL